VRATKRRPVVRLRRGATADAADIATDTRADTLAGEEPMEIRIGGAAFTVTMRTPGDDFDLATGFLVGEGLISGAADLLRIGYGPGVDADGSATYNIVDVTLADGVPAPDPDIGRRVYISSSCGICGTSSIEQVTKQSWFRVADDPLTVSLEALLALPELLRAGQQLFRRTGGVHAAGLFTVGQDGPQLQCLREDVGRHNAVDKVIGRAAMEGRLPLRGTVLQVSGRASFELVQKASMAGIPLLSAVSAPSALAAELAEEVGMTLAGFSRGNSINLYSRPDRVTG